MSTRAAFGPAIQSLVTALADRALRPDPDRDDWQKHSEKIEALYQSARNVYDLRDDGLAGVPMPDDRAALISAIARTLANAGAVLHLARHPRSFEVFECAVTVARGTDDAPLIEQAAREPGDFARLNWAFDLIERKKLARGRAVARELVERSSGPIAQIAAQLDGVSAPINRAPSLFTLNGFGLRFHGRRDPRPDGSYIGTRYVTFLFVPVMPVDSWRVLDGHPSGWQFVGKDVLGPITRWWRRLALTFVVALVGLVAFNSIYNAPERQLARAMDAARDIEAADPAAAMPAWRDVAERFDAKGLGGQPGAEVVRLAVAPVPAKPTVADRAAIERAIEMQRTLPGSAMEQTRDIMARHLIGWAEAVGAGDAAALDFSTELAERAVRLADSRPVQRDAEALRDARAVARARGLAAEWPLDAIRAYADVPRPEATQAAIELWATLSESPSIRAELAPTLRALHDGDLPPEVHRALSDARESARAAEGWAAGEARQALLAEGTDEALAAAVAAEPLDHELTAELVERKLRAGELEAARALITALGPAGRLSRKAQAALAGVMLADGRILEAERLIERQLADMLPRFERARQTYQRLADELESRWIERARNGRLPADLNARLERASEADVQAIFGEFLGEQLAADRAVSAAREAYLSFSGVVPLALELGQLKLQRANGASGEERTRLLGEAERAFLAIRAEAAGVASYHLGLGQVYHRLGKVEEGEAEFAGLLERDDPEVALGVVEAYRELGLQDRARAVAEPLTERAPPVGSAAAIKMALMSADLDERERWLRKADQTAPFVRIELLSLEGDRLLEQGDGAAADRKFAEVATYYDQTADTDSTSANNGALVAMRRYRAVGDPAHLETAGRLMRRALALAPDNGVTATNLAAVMAVLVTHRALSRWVPLDAIDQGLVDLDDVLDALLEGPHRAEVLSALQASREVRGLFDGMRQAQTLAPNRVGNWRGEANWRGRLDDADGLAALAGRVTHVAFGSAAAQTTFAEWVDGTNDADLRGQLREAEQKLSAALAKGGPPVARSILLARRGDVRHQLAVLERDLAIAEQALADYAAAAAVSDVLDWTSAHVSVCETAALLRAAGAAPAARALVERELRRQGNGGVLDLALADDAAQAALAATPDLRRAAELLAASPRLRPRLHHWLVARILGDASLTARSRAVFASKAEHDRMAIAARLAPEAPGPARLLARLERGE